MNVTVEKLTKAFMQWDKDAAAGGWQPTEDPQHNAVSRAEYLMKLLENNS